MIDGITIPGALGVSLLGICVVFAILVLLMCFLYLMPVIAKRLAGKPVGAAAGGAPKSPPPADAEANRVSGTPPIPAAERSDDVGPVVREAVQSKYKIIFKGVAYEVGSEISSVETKPHSSGNAALGTEAAPVAAGSELSDNIPRVEGAKKYRISLNGIEYEADSEIDFR